MSADDRPTLVARVNALLAVRDRLTLDLIRLGADPEWVAKRATTDTWAPHPDHSWAPDATPCTAHPFGESTGATCRETGPGHAHVFLGAPGDTSTEPTGHGDHR